MREGDVALRNAYPRLFRNLEGVRFEGRVHEQVAPSLERCGMITRSSDIVIEHLGYDQGYDVVAQKTRRNNALLLKQVQEHPYDSYARFQLGNSQSILGEYDAAYETLTQVLATKKLSASVASSALNILAEIEIRHGQMEKAIDHANRSLTLAENQMLAKWFLAVAFTGNREYAKALEILLPLRHYSVKKGKIPAFDVVIEPWKIQLQIALCQWALENYEEAIKSIRQAEEFNAMNGSLYETEIKWMLERKDLDGVGTALEQAFRRSALTYSHFKRAIDGALKEGELTYALAFLKYMEQSIPSQIPVEMRPRFEALTLKLAQLV